MSAEFEFLKRDSKGFFHVTLTRMGQRAYEFLGPNERVAKTKYANALKRVRGALNEKVPPRCDHCDVIDDRVGGVNVGNYGFLLCPDCLTRIRAGSEKIQPRSRRPPEPAERNIAGLAELDACVRGKRTYGPGRLWR